MKHKFVARFFFLVILLVMVFNLVGVKPAKAAGIYTHTWFVERAIQRLEEYGGYGELVVLLNRRLGTAYYGALFPDVTYVNNEGWAESVHDSGELWGNYEKYLKWLDEKGYDKRDNTLQTTYYKQFLDDPASGAIVPAFRQYLMDELKSSFTAKPRSNSAEDDIAFLFGIIAHQEADIPWHSTAADWVGAEMEAKKKGPVWNEVTLDQVLYAFDDPEHRVNFNFSLAGSIMSMGYQEKIDPSKNVHISLAEYIAGELAIESLWGAATSNLGKNPEMKGFLQNHTPGGIENGAALVAAAWMRTWDLLSDQTAPAAAPTQSPLTNVYSRKNPDVTITWHWTDQETGINQQACKPTSPSSGKVTLTAQCTDIAGNQGSASYTPVLDVMGNLEALAAARRPNLNWKTSAADLLNLLGMDYSLKAREALALKLGCPAKWIGGDHRNMNNWLHKAVLNLYAENGGKIPDAFLH